MLPYSVVALVGLAFEARIAAGPGVFVICRGPDIAETLRLAYEAGCRSIISFGVAGGLAPDLRPGDWIVALHGRIVASADDIHRLLSQLPLDRPLTVTIVREHRLLDLEVVASTA